MAEAETPITVTNDLAPFSPKLYFTALVKSHVPPKLPPKPPGPAPISSGNVMVREPSEPGEYLPLTLPVANSTRFVLKSASVMADAVTKPTPISVMFVAPLHLDLRLGAIALEVALRRLALDLTNCPLLFRLAAIKARH